MDSGYEFQTKQNDVNQRLSRDSTTTATGPSRGIRSFRRDRQKVERKKVKRREEGKPDGAPNGGCNNRLKGRSRLICSKYGLMAVVLDSKRLMRAGD